MNISSQRFAFTSVRRCARHRRRSLKESQHFPEIHSILQKVPWLASIYWQCNQTFWPGLPDHNTTLDMNVQTCDLSIFLFNYLCVKDRWGALCGNPFPIKSKKEHYFVLNHWEGANGIKKIMFWFSINKYLVTVLFFPPWLHKQSGKIYSLNILKNMMSFFFWKTILWSQNATQKLPVDT